MKIKLKENNIQKILFGVLPLRKNYKKIRFYDYDGTLLYEYTSAQLLALSSLPALPDRTSENLTCDGWNWTLAHIKNQINTGDGDVNIGVNYHTTDNKTHITCRPIEAYSSVSICLTPTNVNAVTVDWGDGTTDIWTSASQTTKSHTYTGVTDSSVYDITISCTSGDYSFNTYFTGSASYNQSYVYTDIKLSNNVTSFGDSCFYGCYSLQSITIPDTVTSFGDSCFYNCYSLQSITIPDTVTSLENSCFYNCYSLQSITIPNTVTNLGSACFQVCCSLQSITIPNTVTSLGTDCFRSCSFLQSIIIPDTVTSFGSNCFRICTSLQSITIPNTVTSFGGSCFYNCFSLQSITIPDTVTSFGSSCFQNCNSLKKIYMQPSTPPTLANANAIPNNTNLVIYVPRGTLSTYQNASNWSNYASKMVEYDY